MIEETEVPNTQAEEDRAFEGLLSQQLSMLATRLTRALSRHFAERFDLTVAEWRVMAVLGRFPGVSAIDVCDITGMDKVQVSRAVGRLMERNLIGRTQDPQDRRRARLRLSTSGQDLHGRVIPFAKNYEDTILAGLTPEEVQTLTVLLGKVGKGLSSAKEDVLRGQGDDLGGHEAEDQPACA